MANRLPITEEGLLIVHGTTLAEDGQRVIRTSGRGLVESGSLVIGLGGGTAYTNTPTVQIIVMASGSSIKGHRDTGIGLTKIPILVVGSTTAKLAITTTVKQVFIISPSTAKIVSTFVNKPVTTFLIVTSASGLQQVGGINLLTVIWTENGFVFLSPELATANWTEEAAIVEIVTGFPRSSAGPHGGRIQTVKSRVTIQ